MNRRDFLKAGAALAGVVVLPAETDEERFLRLSKTGIVDGETFHFKDTVTLPCDGLTMTNCRFFIPGTGPVIAFDNAINLHIDGCHFYFEPTTNSNGNQIFTHYTAKYLEVNGPI